MIKDFLDARKKIIEGRGKVLTANLILENIYSGKTGASATRFYRLKVGGEFFFVKEIEKGMQGRKFIPGGENPHRQIKALEEAKKVIESNPGLGDYEVSVPHLAFSGSNRLFFVSEYQPSFTVEELRKSPELRKKNPGVVEQFDRDFKQLNGLMGKAGVGDFDGINVLYSPLRKKFIIIDVRW